MIKTKILVDRKYLLNNIPKIQRFINVKVLSLEQILTVKHWVTVSDSIPKGMRIKQMNQYFENGNARIHSFPGATSHQLINYLDVNLDKYTGIGIKPILNSASNVNGLLSNIKDMIKKCCDFGVKYIFMSGLIYAKRIILINEFLKDVFT